MYHKLVFALKPANSDVNVDTSKEIGDIILEAMQGQNVVKLHLNEIFRSL